MIPTETYEFPSKPAVSGRAKIYPSWSLALWSLGLVLHFSAVLFLGLRSAGGQAALQCISPAL